MPYGVITDGSTAVELRLDTKHTMRLDHPKALPLLWVDADMDGLGSGSGDTKVRAVLYDAAGTLITTSDEVTILDSEARSRKRFVFPSKPVVAPGKLYVAFIVGGANRSARVWGDDFATPVVNLIRNPDFENDLQFVSSTGNAAISRDTTDKLTGAASCKIVVGAGTSSAGATQTAPLANGGTYTAAVSYKGAVAGDSMRLILRSFNAAGEQVGQSTQAFSTTGAWQVVTFTRDLPLDARSVWIWVLHSNPTTVAYTGWLDRVSLVEGSIANSGNGSDPGWTWDGTPNVSTSRGPQGIVNYSPQPSAEGANTWSSYSAGVVADDDTWSVAGTRSKRVTHDFPGSGVTMAAGVNVINNPMGPMRVTPGERIGLAASVNVRSAYGIGPRFTCLWTGAAQTFHGPTVVSGTPLAEVGEKRIAAVVTIPAGATGMRLTLYVDTGGGFTNIAGPLDMLVDAVQVVRLGPATTVADIPEYHDGDRPGCDWLGAANNSPSIRWKTPEVIDTYSDGSAATLGLTPAAPKLPAGIAASYELSEAPPITVTTRATGDDTPLRVDGDAPVGRLDSDDPLSSVSGLDPLARVA